jgi:hypothetical protein
LAIRVARVIPLKITNSPSVPSYTHGGGIPALDAPNWAIWRWSFTGSAPRGRDDGTCSLRGSTSRNAERHEYQCSTVRTCSESELRAYAGLREKRFASWLPSLLNYNDG